MYDADFKIKIANFHEINTFNILCHSIKTY